MRPARALAGSRPRRALARRGAALAAAAALAALAIAVIAAPAPRAAPAGGQAPPAATATTVTTLAAARLVPAAPAGTAQPAPARLDAASSSCGLFDFACDVGSAITGWFAGLVQSAVNPLVSLIGRTALSTPQPSSLPAVQGMWGTSLAVADACYGLLVVIGGIIVMSHETLQASYSAKEIAPRLVIGFIAANLSMLVMSHAITIDNALSAALTSPGASARPAAGRLLATLGVNLLTGGAITIVLEVAEVVLALVLAATYVLRMMAVVLLAAAAPLLIALYALPQTAWAARWWWRALVAVLAIPVAQALVLTAAVRVFFSPGWLPGGGLEQPLIAACLLYIMTRIPLWIARPVLSPFGSSPARRALRFAFTAAVLSRVTPLLRGTAGRGGGATPARSGRRPPGGPAPASRPRPAGGGGRPGAGGRPAAGRAAGTARAGRSGWAQPPLPGMPSPPRRPRQDQLALLRPPASPGRRPAPAPPPPPRGAAGRRQPPLSPGPPPRRATRPQPPEGSR